MDQRVREVLYLGVRQLNWAGTTWMGLNYYDDSRCVDYLMSRPDVDPDRIGCTGLSGGGWRTNVLAALDRRIVASVSVGWMTTGDYQQVYNVAGAIGTFCLLPGVWDRLDVPDLTIMSAPQRQHGRQRPARQPLPAGGGSRTPRGRSSWASNGPAVPSALIITTRPSRTATTPEVQAEALSWFDRNLKGRN